MSPPETDQRPTVVIVGGSRGTGRVMTKRLVATGRRAILLSRTLPEDLAGFGDALLHIPTDLTRPAEVTHAAAALAGDLNRTSALVFFQRFRGGGDAWESEWQSSVTATRILIDAFAEASNGQGGRAIAIVSSVASEQVAPEQPVGYHTAKAAMTQMARYYAVTLGPKGIRVNAVAPAAVLKPDSQHFYLSNEKLMAMYRKLLPLGRIPTSDEICATVDFLIGPDSSAITGQEIRVDGGISLLTHEALGRLLTQ